MFKTLLNWFTGTPATKSEEVPYKLETPPVLETEATAEQAVEAVKVDAPVAKKKKAAGKKSEKSISVPVLEVAAKFKKEDLEKMTKTDLLALAQERKLDANSKTIKAKLVDLLLKS